MKRNRQVDVSQLEVEMVVKNYPALCQLLDENITCGTSKIHQLERWKRYFDFERVPGSQAYKITCIYDTPIPLPVTEKEKEKTEKPQPTKARRGIYRQYAEYLLMQTVFNSDKQTVRTSKMQFIRALGLRTPKLDSAFNDARQKAEERNRENEKLVESATQMLQERFGDTIKISGAKEITPIEMLRENMIAEYSDDPEKKAIAESITIWNLRTFLKRIDAKARIILTSAVESMEKRGLVRSSESYNVLRDCSDEYMAAGVVRRDGYEFDENEVIESAKREVLTEMGFKTESEAYLRGKLDAFHQSLIDKISEPYGILDVRKQLRITARIAEEDYEEPVGFDEKTKMDIIADLNREYIEGLEREAIGQHQRIVDKYMGGMNPMEKGYKKERRKEDYVLKQTFLANHFL